MLVPAPRPLANSTCFHVLALAVIACSGPPRQTDASTDATPDDASEDAANDEPRDASRDVGPVDVGVCATAPLVASCMYRGYGSVCDVPCSFPPTCTFTAQVTWTGGYCCGAAPESFVDCVCDRGNARCRIPYTPAIGDRTFPTTFCELCWDAGGPIDVGADDGG